MSATQNIKLGLLTETITLALSNNDYIIQRVDFADFQRPTVEFIISEGTTAIIKGIEYSDGTQVRFSRNDLRSSKTVYLYKSSWNTTVDIQKFFGGSYQLSLSISPTVRGSFSIVGSATGTIFNYPSLVTAFGRTMTTGELVAQVSEEFKRHIRDEISTIANKYITPTTTEVELQSHFSEIINEFRFKSGPNSASTLTTKGLQVIRLSLGLNTLPETDELISRIQEEIAQRGMRDINADETRRLAEEEDKKRKHELELERIKKTTITEKKEDIKKEVNSVVVKDESKEKKEEKLHCTGCGKVVEDTSAKFCKHCGEKIIIKKKEEKLHCTGCGKLVEDKTAKFCKHCGKEIK